MTRAHESGAYLGGIGTMLSVMEVCALCGRAHRSRQTVLGDSETRGCPSFVAGPLPIFDSREVFAVPAEEPPARSEEMPVSLASVPTFASGQSRRSVLPRIPFMVPTDLEGYL